MKKTSIQFLLSFLFVICFTPYSFSTVSKKEIKIKLNSVSIPFIENRGQVSKEVRFYAKTFGGTVFITRDGEIVYSLPRVERKNKKDVKEKFLSAIRQKGVVIKEEFYEGRGIKGIKGEKKAITKVNIFKGKK